MQGEFYVSKPSTFMHLYPDKKSEVTDELLYGTNVFSVEESYGGFLLCKTDYGYLGYVEVSALSKRAEKGERFVVTSSFCDVFSYPEYNFAPLTTIPQGSVLCGEGKKCRDERFTLIKSEGRELFVPSANIQKSTTLSRFEDVETKKKQLLKAAFSYLGTPYRWGGKSPVGIDCSGLCFMAFALSGLGLYRDAEFDARYVKEISFDELSTCDLIYYNGHVTMYIGGGEYIHSSATLGGVKISSFDEKADNYYPRLKSGIVRCARSHCLNHES